MPRTKGATEKTVREHKKEVEIAELKREKAELKQKNKMQAEEIKKLKKK
jgi:hypothetical protein